MSGIRGKLVLAGGGISWSGLGCKVVYAEGGEPERSVN